MMFHKLGINYTFNIPSSIFINIEPKLAYARQGNYFIDGSVGPDCGFALETNKLNAVRKAISEVIERRCSMLGEKSSNNKFTGNVETWDIVNNRRSCIEPKYTRFLKGTIDTTGSAIHFNSASAICSALKELFEKNSLFLFWYGLKGFRVLPKYYNDNPYFQSLKESGFSVSVFVNTFFSPLKNIILIAYKEKDQFICGLGSNTKYQKAIDHAFEEAYSIGAFRYYWLMLGKKFKEEIWCTTDRIKHVEELKKLEYVDFLENEVELSIESLLSGKPTFIRELHVFFAEQYLIPSLKYVRVYSEDLLNCLPLKNNINFNLPINQETLELNQYKIKNIPECPMS